MTTKTMTKHLVQGAVLVGAFALTGMGPADAHPREGGPGWFPAHDEHGPGHCYQTKLDEKTIAARKKFLSETVAFRREMAVKRAELDALMNNDNPDAKRIAQLTGEIFDLREQLWSKAEASGLEGPGMRGLGCGGCNGPDDEPGQGPDPGPGPRPDSPPRNPK